MKLSRVVWIDSEGSTGWEFASKRMRDRKPGKITTIGYVITDSEDNLLLAQSVGFAEDDGSYSVYNTMNIPRCSIIEQEEIIIESP